MRFLVIAGALLVVAFSARGGFAGFETGCGVPLTGGVARVNFMANKEHTIKLTSSLRLTILEVQITLTSGTTKRHTMLFAGQHALRAPLPIELVEILGSLCLLALVCGIIAVVSSTFRFRRAEPGASPNGGPTALSGNSGVTEGPPSVS